MATRELKFVLDTGGTTLLGADTTAGSPVLPVISNWSFRAEGPLTRLDVDSFYFVSPGTDDLAVARTLVGAYLEASRTSMLYKPPVIKELARGAAAIPNTHANKGSVKRADNTVILADCYLESAAVTDDTQVNGIGLRFTFVAVAPRGAP